MKESEVLFIFIAGFLTGGWVMFWIRVWMIIKTKKSVKCFLWFFHDWEYLGSWGITYQQKRCKKCNKLKIIDQ